jgi:hypothetical protein
VVTSRGAMLLRQPRLAASLGRRMLAPARRCHSTTPQPPVRWPLYLTGATTAVVVGSATAIAQDSFLVKLLQDSTTAFGSLIESPQSDQQKAGSVSTTTAVAYCYALCSLPIDEVKLKLLRNGALHVVLQLFDCGMHDVGIDCLNHLLSGAAALEAFRKSTPADYERILGALQVVLSPREANGSPLELWSIERAQECSRALSLATTLTTHPQFELSEPLDSERALWLGLLEAGALSPSLPAAATLQLAALSAACAKHGSLARTVRRRGLLAPRLKRYAATGADTLIPLPDDQLPSMHRAQRQRYAGLALQRLTASTVAAGPASGSLWVSWRNRRTGATQQDPSGPSLARSEGGGAPTDFADLPARPTAVNSATSDTSPEIVQPSALFWSGLGGLTWGSMQGLRASSRAVRSVGRSAGSTAAAALGLQLALSLLDAAWRELLQPQPPLFEQHYETLAGYTTLTCVHVSAAGGILWLLAQPQRAPFVMGGSVLGQLMRYIAAAASVE